MKTEKHQMGRYKLIESPEKLLELWEQCKEEILSNPIKVHDYVGKDAEEVYRLKQRPLTLEAFKVFCFKLGITVSNYFDNQHDAYKDYYVICSHIRNEIRLNQVEGGMVGIFNPSITQRLNGLTEKTENTTTINTDGELIITGKKFAKGE